MKAINDHIFGINQSLLILKEGKYWLYLIPSLAIGLLFWFVGQFLSEFFDFLNNFDKVPLIGSYLSSGVEVSKGFFSYLGDFFYQFVILTLLSPVYCLLSEAVDNKLSGANFSGGLVRILTDLLRMIFIVFFSTIFYFTLMAAWWMISWIIGLAFLDEIMNLLIGAFFLGFSFYDFSLERYNVSNWKSWMFSFEKISHMLLTGIIFNLIFLIPFVGVIFSPFLVTIISTAVFLKMNNKIPTLNQNISNSDSKSNE
jgi:CysZ protein